MNEEFYESMLGDFLDESRQLLDRLNEHALALDEWMCALAADHTEHCDVDLLNEMFRSAHSLKGLSAMLSLTDFNQLTHRLENILDAARKKELFVRADCVELVFRAIDRLTALTDALQDDRNGPPPGCAEITEEIARYLREADCERLQSTQADAERLLEDCRQASEAGESEHETNGEGKTSPLATRGLRVAERVYTPPTAEAAPAGAIDAASDDSRPVRRWLDVDDEAEVQDRYLSVFVDEADMTLDRLVELLTAESSDAPEQLAEELMVEWHRLKGSAASIGLKRVARISHLVEDALNEIVECDACRSADVTDVVLSCVDGVRDYVEVLRTGEKPDDRFEQLARQLMDVFCRRGQAESPDKPHEAEPGDGSCDSPLPPSEEGEPARQTAQITDALRLAVRDAIAEHGIDSARVAIVRIRFEPGLPLTGLKAQLIRQRISSVGEIIYSDPSPEHLESAESLPTVAFALLTSAAIDEVQTRVWVAGVLDADIEVAHVEEVTEASAAGPPSTADSPRTLAASGEAVEELRDDKRAAGPDAADPTDTSRAAPDRAAQPASPDGRKKPTETLRVEITRLDHLMNLTGQLTIAKARFRTIGQQFRDVGDTRFLLQGVQEIREAIAGLAPDGGSNDSLQTTSDRHEISMPLRRIEQGVDALEQSLAAVQKLHDSVRNLDEAVHQLDRIAEGIQQGVMDTRMVPIGPLFNRFKRVIRDVTRANGKTVRLIIRGENTELDKRMIDELGDPLIHLVRNAADHGIESAAERVELGKPEHGTIILDAYHRGNNVFIEVADDGRGLDPERIRDKAVSRGILTEAEAARMTPSQMCQLIWEAGLSTADRVTEVSGRGMGMDIVKQKIEDINGAVELTTARGRGTRISIKLPLTLAILPSLMVEVAGDVFAIPVEAVREIVDVSAAELPTMHGRRTTVIRDRVVSVVEMADLLSWNRSMRLGDASDDDSMRIVLLADRGREVGLAVSRILGEDDVVIKSMAENYQNVRGIAGACILGDGRIALILNVSYLMEAAAHLEVTAVS